MIRSSQKLFCTALAIALMAGTGFCEEDTGRGEEDERLVLGEEDLAERGEIARNMFRRITPGDEPLVQDVGTWPVAWEEFAPNWAAAAVGREYGAWVVPFSLAQESGTTVIRDANDTVLWRGETDFAKPESASVTLVGGLVAEEDWAAYEGVRDWVETNARLDDTPSRGATYTNGLRFTSVEVGTNGTVELSLAWEEDGDVDIFAYLLSGIPSTNVVTWTNDENQVVTTTNTVWEIIGENLSGFDNAWEWRGMASVTNGECIFTDSGAAANPVRMGFYAAAEANDTDGDGLNDGVESFVHHTDPENTDSDGDGEPDGTDPYPGTSNVFWSVTTTKPYTNRWYIDDLPSWPNTPTQKVRLVFTTSPPVEVCSVTNVRISGFVDDAISVDGNPVDWACGPQTFTNRSIVNEITNLQSGRFELMLYDWPTTGYSGPNEVRLGDTNGNPFLAEWDWGVPVDMRMEPILGGDVLPLDNPSGVVLGSNVWFHVEISPPGVVPEDKIKWTTLSNHLTLMMTNCGSWMQVHGTSLGEDGLSVALEGAAGNFSFPPFHVQVLPLTVVTVKVGVVSNNGTWAMDSNTIETAVSTANSILCQAGIELQVETPFEIIEAENGFWDVDSRTNRVQALLNCLQGSGVVKVYCVHSITMLDGTDGAGVNYPRGLLLAGSLPSGHGRTLAHELGHICGLRDIFPEHAETNAHWRAAGPIREAWMPKDWGNYGLHGGEEWQIQDFMPRLLMYWQTVHSDIPSGPVYGVWYSHENSGKVWHEGNVPLGLDGMTNPPVHQ